MGPIIGDAGDADKGRQSQPQVLHFTSWGLSDDTLQSQLPELQEIIADSPAPVRGEAASEARIHPEPLRSPDTLREPEQGPRARLSGQGGAWADAGDSHEVRSLTTSGNVVAAPCARRQTRTRSLLRCRYEVYRSLGKSRSRHPPRAGNPLREAAGGAGGEDGRRGRGRFGLLGRRGRQPRAHERGSGASMLLSRSLLRSPGPGPPMPQQQTSHPRTACPCTTRRRRASRGS